MSHLEIHRIFDLIGGLGTADDQSHLEGCDACSRQLEVWRGRLGDLRELESNAVDASEMHMLRVLYRELGPAPAGLNWVAQLIRGSVPAAAAAVRGGLSSTLNAYQAGPYEIVVQIRPSKVEGRFDLQGQLASDEAEVPKNARVVFTSELGYVDQAGLDAYGEFRLTAVPEGPYRLVWCGDGERIELDVLAVGESDDVDRS